LLVALFGCIVSALNYAIISGYDQKEDYPQIHTAALFTGAGFSLSILLVFLALVIICHAFLNEDASRSAQLLVVISGFGASIFLNINVYGYRDSLPNSNAGIGVLVTPIAVSLFLYFLFPVVRFLGRARRFLEGLMFKGFMVFYSILISAYTIAALFALMTSNLDVFPPSLLQFVAAAQSLVFGILLSTTPEPQEDMSFKVANPNYGQ